MRIVVWFAALMLMAPWGAQAACTVTAGTLNFGIFTTFPSRNTGSFQVTCSSNTNYSVGVSNGAHWGNEGGYAWHMIGPNSSLLHYWLFSDAALNNYWGNTPGTNTLTGLVGNGAAQTVNIYGEITASTPPPGSYSDVVTMYVYSSFPTVSASVNVSATAPKSCNISANPLNFGSYIGVALNAQTTLAVTCTNTTPYYVNINNGNHQDGAFYPRMLGPNGALLSYRFYQNSGRTIEWRNSVNLDGQAGTGNGNTQTLSVYGQILAGQTVAPGSYADTVIATITY